MPKKEIRLLGIDDAPFEKFGKKRYATVIGVLFRGGAFMDGCLTTRVIVDGNDATRKLISLIGRCKWKQQLKAILLNGIAVGGFNVIDIMRLSRETGIPVIVVTRHMPDIANIKKILVKLGMQRKAAFIDRAGDLHKHKRILFQCSGIEPSKAIEILDISCTRSLIPEPIRVAHLIGQGLVFGQSKGRA